MTAEPSINKEIKNRKTMRGTLHCTVHTMYIICTMGLSLLIGRRATYSEEVLSTCFLLFKQFNDGLCSRGVYCVLACTKFFRCDWTSIPNMEIINKKYLIKTKNSKIIIYMRVGILSFSANKA